MFKEIKNFVNNVKTESNKLRELTNEELDLQIEKIKKKKVKKSH
jgi:hypothetical protein